MKAIILNGDNNQASYARLTTFINEAKKRNWEIVNDRLEDSHSLFGMEKLIIVRSLKSLTDQNLAVIPKITGTIVFHFEKKINKTDLDRIYKFVPQKDIKIEEFKLSSSLWKFLDTFSLDDFNASLLTEPVELVFSLLATKITDIYKFHSGIFAGPSWIKNKVSYLAKRIGPEKTVELIQKLAQIDYDAKTGKTDLKLAIKSILVNDLT